MFPKKIRTTQDLPSYSSVVPKGSVLYLSSDHSQYATEYFELSVVPSLALDSPFFEPLEHYPQMHETVYMSNRFFTESFPFAWENLPKHRNSYDAGLVFFGADRKNRFGVSIEDYMTNGRKLLRNE